MAEKYKENDLQNLPVCAQEYIKLVIKKMRYRKKVRADVMAELAAHFEDELRDCKTDGEKKQKAQKLIEQFGDAKLLAILLRRAKKRCRPLWRTVVARTFQTIGVLILCLTIYIIWFFTGRPTITVDYVAELNKLTRPVADESLNAAPLYQKAVELIEFKLHKKPSDEPLMIRSEDVNSAQRQILFLMRKEWEDVNSVQKQLVKKWLTDNKEIFDWIATGTQKPYYWESYKGERAFAILLPNVPRFRELARLLLWRSQLSAEQGQYENTFDDIITCYRFGQHIRKGDKSIIEQVVGVAIEEWAVRTLCNILSKYLPDSAPLTKLQKDLEQMIANENFAISFKTEKLCMYDEIQRCFTEDQWGGGHPSIPEFRKIMELALLMRIKENETVGSDFFSSPAEALKITCFALIHPSKKKTLKTTNELFDYFDKFTLHTPAQSQREKVKIDEKIKQITNIPLLSSFCPAYEKLSEISYQLKINVEATLTIIAILRYKQDKGQCPQNLDELLLAGYIKEIPVDPFSDKPLVYKKTDDNFILYSVGLNFKDDGGDNRGRKGTYWGEEGDAVFWPVPK